MLNNEYIKKIEINNYDELVKTIHGKTNFCKDLREKFVFRGLEDDTYELIPSALRKDKKLDDFVDEDFKLTLQLDYEKATKYGFVKKEDKYNNLKSFPINKYGQLINENVNDHACSMEGFQIRKELNALMKFLSYADKVGLKVPIKQEVRQFIEHNPGNILNHDEFWPKEEYYELISLAQHYGIPTRALDWSYDYRTALYFSVKNILNDDYLIKDKPKNAVLWAFNYKYFNRSYTPPDKTYFTNYYRPEYNSNPNLNSQKGLFTFMIKRVNENANEPFNKFIEELINKYNNENGRIIPQTENAFYKFIIPEDEKPNILKELYSEGYSEEYLFPGYDGVRQTIENRVKLDRLIKKI